MQTLDQYLQELFGGSRPGSSRLVAAGERHAVHESGYDVSYSRYSVTYRDAGGELLVGAEFDEEGVLVVHSAGIADRRAIARIAEALRFLGVKHELR